LFRIGNILSDTLELLVQKREFYYPRTLFLSTARQKMKCMYQMPIRVDRLVALMVQQ
jgi:hypothetical protein